MKIVRTSAGALAGAMMILSVAAFGQKNVPPPPPAETVLIEVLKSNADLQKKSEACRMLGQVGTKAAVPALAGLLSHEQLADRARYALEQIPDPSVGQALRTSIPALQGRNLVGALMSLGALSTGATAAADTGLASGYLKNADGKVAGAASYALAKIATPASAKAIEQAIAGASPSFKAELWDGLLRATAILAKRGQNAAAAGICDRLIRSDAPTHIRAAAARGGVIARKSGAGSLIAKLLHHTDNALFVIGLELAHEVSGEDTTRAVAGAVAKLPAARQSLVVQALGKRGDIVAMPAIRAAAHSGNAAVRSSAFSALADIGDVESLNLLVDAAASGTDAAEAKSAAVRLRGTVVDEALTKVVAGPNSAKSLVAIELLARRQNAVAVPALFRAAAQPSGPVKMAAIGALGDLAGPSDVPALLDSLTKAADAQEIEATEQALIKVCGRADDPAECADRISGRMAAARPGAKSALLRVLVALGGPKALQTIRSAGSDSDTDVRDTAIRAICNWPSQEVAQDLLTIARNSSVASHKLLAVRGFLRLAGDENLPADRKLSMAAEVRPLITRDDEKRQWIGAVGAAGSPRSLELLAGMVDDPNVSEDACAAVAAVAGKVLKGPEAASPGVKGRLTALSALLEKCQQKTGDAKLKGDLQALIARVKELKG